MEPTTKKTARRVAARVGQEAKEIVRDDLLNLGAFKTKKGAFLWLTGLDVLGKSAAAAARPCIGLGRLTWRIGKAALGSGPKYPPLPTDSEDPQVRFWYAQQRFGRDEADVERDQLGQTRVFYAWYIAAVLLWFWGAYLYRSGVLMSLRNFHPALEISTCFSFALLASVKTVAHSYYNYCLRHRGLYPVGHWLRRPREWMNVSAKKAAQVVSCLALVAVLAAAGEPSPAFAADGASALWTGTLPANDLFHRMVEYMLAGVGNIGADVSTPYASPLKAAFAQFNGGLLSIASMMVAYHTIVGMTATAQEGRLLGDKWNTIWAPVRVGTGIATLAPLSGGFCAAQLLVIQLVIAGGNLANTVWGGYVDSMTLPALVKSFNDAPVPDALSVSLDFARKEVCTASLRAQLGPLAGTPTAPAGFFDRLSRFLGGSSTPSVPDNVTGQVDGNKLTWDYGPICGKIVFDLGAVPDAQDPAVKAAYSARTAHIQDIVTAVEQGRAALIGWAVNLDTLVTTGKGEALPTDTLASEVSVVRDQYSNAVRSFAEAIRASLEANAAKSDVRNSTGGAGSAHDAFIADAKSAGWASAGAFYYTASRLQGQLYRLAEIPHATSPVRPDLLDANLKTESVVRLLGDKKAGREGTLTTLEEYFARVVARTPALRTEAVYAGVNTTPSGDWVADVMGLLGIDSLSTLVRQFKPDPINPMLDMTNFGFRALTASGGFLTATMATGVGGVVLGAAVGTGAGPFGTVAGAAAGLVLGQVLDKLSFVLNGGFVFLLTVGTLYAYALPVMAYVVWTFFVWGVVVMVAEGVVAASLWALAHVRMDGDTFVTQASQGGYMVAFNMVLRASLGLFGLMLSFGAFAAGVFFLSETLGPMLDGITAGRGFGIVGTAFAIGLYAYMHYQLAVRSFGLIVEVPDRVTRWFGASAEHLNEGQHAAQVGAAMTGVALGRMSGVKVGVGSAAQGLDMGRRMRETTKKNP